MNDFVPPDGDPTAPSDPPHAPTVNLGQAMPQVRSVPVLAGPFATGSGLPHSMIARGLRFVGTAHVEGALTVAGEVVGHLNLPAPAQGHVTITESGSVEGDVVARNISVLGRTQGLLDASGGKVSLHDSASVSGRIRYTHLQVNGADLNAQLERVRQDPSGH